MITIEEIERRIEESIRVKRSLLGQAALLKELALLWSGALRRENKILFFGNGGSAADAQHMECELAGRFYLDRRPAAAVSLTVNTSSLTAIGNDYGFADTFSRPLAGLAHADDVLIGLSTSGRSPNVVGALQVAKAKGLYRIGFTGADGGQMRDLSDVCLCVPSQDSARIQEVHITVGHVICEMVDFKLFQRSDAK